MANGLTARKINPIPPIAPIQPIQQGSQDAATAVGLPATVMPATPVMESVPNLEGSNPTQRPRDFFGGGNPLDDSLNAGVDHIADNVGARELLGQFDPADMPAHLVYLADTIAGDAKKFKTIEHGVTLARMGLGFRDQVQAKMALDALEIMPQGGPGNGSGMDLLPQGYQSFLPDVSGLHPMDLHDAKRQAAESRKGSLREAIARAAAQGIEPEDLHAANVHDSKLNEALRQIEANLRSSNGEYEAAVANLGALVRPEVPTFTKSGPALGDQLASLVAMFLDQRFAAAYSGLPNALADERDKDEYSRRLEHFKLASGAHEDARGELLRRLGMARDDRSTAQNQRLDVLGRQASDAEDRDRFNRVRTDDMTKAQLAIAERALTGVQNRWNAANTPGEKRAAAAAWRELDPDTAPPPETVDREATFLGDSQLRNARTDWDKAITQVANSFGEVDEANEKALEAYRQQLADRYADGDLTAFREVPTGKTIQKQRAEEVKREFDLRFEHTKEVDKKRLANAAAMVAIARDRLEQMAQLGGARLNIQAGRYLMDVRKGAAALKEGATKEYDEVNKKLGIEAAVLQGMRKRGEDKREVGVSPQTGLPQVGTPEYWKQLGKVQRLRDTLHYLEGLQVAAGDDEAFADSLDPQAGEQFKPTASPGGGGNAPVKLNLGGPIPPDARAPGAPPPTPPKQEKKPGVLQKVKDKLKGKGKGAGKKVYDDGGTSISKGG